MGRISQYDTEIDICRHCLLPQCMEKSEACMIRTNGKITVDTVRYHLKEYQPLTASAVAYDMNITVNEAEEMLSVLMKRGTIIRDRKTWAYSIRVTSGKKKT